MVRDGSMDVLDTNIAGSAEGGNRAPTRPQSSIERMVKRDANKS